MRDLPPADRVSQLISEVGVDKRGAMTAGREVANKRPRWQRRSSRNLLL